MLTPNSEEVYSLHMPHNDTLGQFGERRVRTAPEAKRIQDVIIERIQANRYPVGSRMPTCRELADELKVNQNTVSRVYQHLGQQGVLLPQVGRGTFVLRSPLTSKESQGIRTQCLVGLREELIKAKRSGLSRDQAMDLVHEALESVYAGTKNVAFVECTPADTRQVAEFLSRAMQTTVDPIVLGDLLDSPDMALQYNVLTTTFYHLSEVTEVLDGTGIEVIGLQHEPSSETLLRIARLSRGSAVAVVAPNDRTIERLVSLVTAYGLKVAVTTTPETVTPQLLAEAGVVTVIDIRSSHSQAVVKYRHLPCITVDFSISPQSMNYLQQRCSEYKAGK